MSRHQHVPSGRRSLRGASVRGKAGIHFVSWSARKIAAGGTVGGFVAPTVPQFLPRVDLQHEAISADICLGVTLEETCDDLGNPTEPNQ